VRSTDSWQDLDMSSRRSVEKLTSREEEVLLAVGQRLTNPEIADRLFISVRTVESHVSALLRKLDAGSRAELVAAAEERARDVIEIPHNSFVGRDAETEQIRKLIDTHRLVTITGAPGCGKTRLALEATTDTPAVPIVVALEHDVRLLPALARVMGLTASRGADMAAVCGVALSTREHVLVLDDCDLVEDAARSLPQLMALVPSLRIIVTSRTPLGLSDEVVFLLDPLGCDGERSAAVRLFCDRARQSAPMAPLTEDDLERVTRICQQLDGLPLAIELAAARMRHLTIDELERRISDRLSELGEPRRVDHQRTLEMAFAWSWELLDSREQLVLANLAGLPDDFDAEMAVSIAGENADRILLRLLDRSMLTVSLTTATPRRYRLLGPLRAFVVDHTDPSTLDASRRSHALFTADRVGDHAQRLRVDDRKETTRAARAWVPDASSATLWSIEHDPQLAVRLATSLSIMLEHVGPTSSGISILAVAARSPEVMANADAGQLLRVGICLLYSDLDLGMQTGLLALDKANRRPGDRLAANTLMGCCYAYGDDPARAFSYLEVAEELAAEMGDSWYLGLIMQAQGTAQASLGDVDLALGSFNRATELFARAGDVMHVNNSRYLMARLAVDAGVHLDEARHWAEQCVAHALDSGNEHELAHARLVLAALPTYPRPEQVIESTMDVFQTVGDLRCLTRAYVQLADLGLARSGSLGRALSTSLAAKDRKRQAAVGLRLVDDLWQSGRQRDAALVVGALRNAIGSGAVEEIPTELRSELWRSVLLEGEAAGLASVLESLE
jgi:DNA-binding CsgD family transcriptional regulator